MMRNQRREHRLPSGELGRRFLKAFIVPFGQHLVERLLLAELRSEFIQAREHP